jgi:ubiquinone biosynthesis protein
MRKLLHGISRFLLIAATLTPLYFSYFWLWLRATKLKSKVSGKEWADMHTKQARRFYRLAVRMRGGMIKVGQLISARVDIMPQQWITELSKLQDRVDPCPWPVIEKHLLKEYGKPLDEIFETIEHQAVAAASFGQVHRATTKDGRKVALKVRYPEVKMQLDVDMALFGIAVPMFNVFVPKVKLGVVYDEMQQALKTELDYHQEAEYTRTIHDNLKDVEGTYVPEVYGDISTDSIIGTSYFEGWKINDKAKIAELGLDPNELLTSVLNAWCKQMYVDGVFQSDPHPGNLLFSVDENNKPIVCILDFGQVKILPKDFHDKLLNGVMTFLSRDPDQFKDSMVAMGVVSQADAEKMKPLIAEFFEKYYHLTPVEVKGLDFDKIRDDVRGLIKSLDGVVIPQDIVLYGRTFGLLAGLCTAMDENINGFELAKPLILKWMAYSAMQPQKPAPSDPKSGSDSSSPSLRPALA